MALPREVKMNATGDVAARISVNTNNDSFSIC